MVSRLFKAVLKSEGDLFLENGRARINFDDKSVEFRNEFVPLMKFGTVAKVIRIIGDEETHCFTGKVYLSSRKLLRIVDVKDQILAEAELSLANNTSIKAHVTPVIDDSPLFRTPLKKLVRFDIDIYSISMSDMKFSSAENFNVGERLLVASESPVHMKKVLIEVEKLLLFGENATGHHCRIVSLPEQSSRNLSEYMSKLNQYFPSSEDAAVL